MEHAITGLSGKVLNERLIKLVRFGNKFIKLLDEVDDLQRAVDAMQQGEAETPRLKLFE